MSLVLPAGGHVATRRLETSRAAARLRVDDVAAVLPPSTGRPAPTPQGVWRGGGAGAARGHRDTEVPLPGQLVEGGAAQELLRARRPAADRSGEGGATLGPRDKLVQLNKQIFFFKCIYNIYDPEQNILTRS